ncbi:aldehyde dehydrogenase family protein [Mesorhizobium sp. KR1-2]|uniref:aldehyde dehydrogenase family protein n=1 Tax=Mesorhizobium sp. KR1-2 TaxID=3156609 RepID=UPI0032B39A00
MEPQIRTLVDIAGSKADLHGRADMMLERARWAGQIFQRYDRNATMAIVDAVAKAAHANAGKYADWAVEETGFGVAAHKKLKNELASTGLVEFYRNDDYVNPRIDAAAKMVKLPRPAGVVFALTPSTNPVATLYYKVLLALMTRNAIVISPHPAARACCVDAAHTLMAAARAAGAPDAIIQIVEEPNIPLIEEFMASPKTSVILATGGNAVVRAAYSSSNPAIGVGPGNAPVYVDPSADIDKAARRIVDGKSFDNSVLCTNESVVLTLPEVDKQLRRSMQAAGAYFCEPDETERLRSLLFHPRGFNVECVGRDAVLIAEDAGIRVPEKTRILVTPIDQIGVEERLSKEKLCPVLAYHVAKNRTQALSHARAILRMTGAGHSAAIHANDPSVIMAYGNAVEAYRIVVNSPCSQGAAGFGTNLAPTFTVGTGYFGRSSIGENVGPQHLVHWSRIAYSTEADVKFGNFENLGPNFEGPLPTAPSDGVPGSAAPRRPVPSAAFSNGNAASPLSDAARDELRRLIAEELRAVLKER